MSRGKVYTSILPDAQRILWPRLAEIPGEFVLYGGTALALQLGHRPSIDFDFFSKQAFDPQTLYDATRLFEGSTVRQLDNNTLSVSVAAEPGSVLISLFGGLRMQMVRPALLADNGISIASVEDVFGCKCAVVQKRSEYKDYFDICSILEMSDLSLAHGLACANAIYGTSFNPLITLKALTYTADLDEHLSDSHQQLLRSAVRAVDIQAPPGIQAWSGIEPAKSNGQSAET